jgi:ketosteroid isomerase-like protein
VSVQSVEIVRRGLDLLRASYESGEATDELLALCAPDIRVDAARRVFNPDVYEGRSGVRRAIREICDAWEDFRTSTERLIEAEDRVVVIQIVSARGRASQAQVQQRGALIWTIRDGLAQLIEVFGDPGEALKAVGLEEEQG